MVRLKKFSAMGAAALCIALGSGCRDDSASATDGSTSDGSGDGTADESGQVDDTGEPDAGVVLLEPTDHLVRVSMALRGVRPSPEELLAVNDDPDLLPEFVDAYLDDPRFGTVVRDLHNDALLVLADFLVYPAGFLPKGPVAEVDSYRLNRSITEAPLRLVEHVVTRDLPYSEIVTADYTLADGNVAAVWGLPYDGDGESWTTTQWQDERDHAGILSDPWLFQRHGSTYANANRGRANAISRALLCYDFLSRDIEVDAAVNLADPDAVANAVVENPSCASCHQALDPLASFFGDWSPTYVPADVDYPFDSYLPGVFVDAGVQLRDPGYFGQAGEGLGELGQLIADDPRFSRCTAERFYAYFHQIEVEDVPLQTAAELQAVFRESDMSAKALVRAIVLDDAFRVSHLDDEEAADVVGVKKARPAQVALLFFDLTGFAWQTDLTEFELAPVDLMADSFLGYNVLLGGIDSLFVTRPSHTYSATASLVLRNLAREAADAVVDADFAQSDPSARRLLRQVGPSDTDETAIREQLVALHLRIFSSLVAADDPEIDETYELFVAALQHSGDVPRAWKVTLTAMLQDIKVAYY